MAFEHKPKESSNGEPLGAGLHTIYTTIHKGCARLSVGLCTVHDITVELISIQQRCDYSSVSSSGGGTDRAYGGAIKMWP